MKFVVDAQLPRRLAKLLQDLGYDAQHTWGLDLGNRTPDGMVARIADHKEAVVITKDSDFLNSHILNGSPQRLLLVSTGNISNRKLLQMFERHMGAIVSSFQQSKLIELSEEGLMIHES